MVIEKLFSLYGVIAANHEGLVRQTRLVPHELLAGAADPSVVSGYLRATSIDDKVADEGAVQFNLCEFDLLHDYGLGR